MNASAIPLFRHSGHFVDKHVGGANPKNVLVLGDPDDPERQYIAKKPRKWLRECVTEAVLGTIAKALPIRSARFALVRLPTRTGEPDVRFMSEVFLRPGEALVHGVEIAARYLETQPSDLHEVFGLGPRNEAKEREFYTIETILPMLEAICRTATERQELVRDFGKMVIFDAFVGVQDRHAENWGVVECALDPARALRFAPLYDTARGLFVSHGDDKLSQWIADGHFEQEIESYAESSRPLFGCAGHPNMSRLTHFELVRHMLDRHRARFLRVARTLVGAIDLIDLERRIRKTYAGVVTEARLRAIIALLRYRYSRLSRIVLDEARSCLP